MGFRSRRAHSRSRFPARARLSTSSPFSQLTLVGLGPALSMLALCLVLLQLASERLLRGSAVSFFAGPLATGPRGTRNSERARTRRGNRGGRNTWFVLHVALSALGLALMALASLPRRFTGCSSASLRRGASVRSSSASRRSSGSTSSTASRSSRVSRTDARCPARARLRGAVLRRLACRQGADRMGDLYLGGPRLGGLGPRRPPIGPAAARPSRASPGSAPSCWCTSR